MWTAGLWQTIRLSRYDEKLICILADSYKDTTRAVRADGERTSLTGLQLQFEFCKSVYCHRCHMEVVMALALADHDAGEGGQDFRNTNIEPTLCR